MNGNEALLHWPLRSLLLASVSMLLTACGQSKQAVCDEETEARARRFITQILEQEATGLRLRELTSKEGRPVFYANVAYERDKEPTWNVTYIRNSYRAVDAVCVSRAIEGASAPDGTALPLVDVRVEFPAGYWFDREAFGELPPGEHTYTLRLQDDKLKVIARLPTPFVSNRTAMSLLTSDAYADERLSPLREELVKTLQPSKGVTAGSR